jgi:heme/copper-type cytochrome/quinol oxidase subunit 3
MNSNSYIVSGIIAFVFLVAKFLEMRFTNNVVDAEEGEDNGAQPQSKPLKFLLRDTLLVYMSSLLGFYVISQFEEHVATNAVVKEVAAFTGGPDF